MTFPNPYDFRDGETKEQDEHFQQFKDGEIPDCNCHLCKFWRQRENEPAFAKAYRAEGLGPKTKMKRYEDDR